MTKEEFATLKAGDIVIRYGKPSLVVNGHANCLHPELCKHLYVTVTLFRKSWRRKWDSVFGYHDIKNGLVLFRCDKETAVRMALQLSRDAGFDVLRGLDVTLAEMERTNTRGPMHCMTSAPQYLKYLRRRLAEEQSACLEAA